MISRSEPNLKISFIMFPSGVTPALMSAICLHGSGPWVDPFVNNNGSKFCIKLFHCLYLNNCIADNHPKVHDNSVALLLKWTSGSGAWMGPGINKLFFLLAYGSYM